MQTLLSIIIALSSIIVIATVAVTESEQAGLGTMSGEESVWGEHRGSSKKELQNRVIMISSIVFIVALLVLAKLG